MILGNVNQPRSLPLLIGQAPGPNTRPDMPLFPVPSKATGGRLRVIMGINKSEYLERFDRINLLPYFPGSHKREDKFPIKPAKLAAAVLLPLLAGRTVILVGRSVANAFGFDEEWHCWTKWRPLYRPSIFNNKGIGVMVVVPHPSGRNPWYSDPENLEVAKTFWHKFFLVS